MDKGEPLTLDGKGVLILSPAFYWFHRERLDITPAQARKIAPSIFEGMIPPGEYSYFVERVGDEYHFYAYEDGKILAALQEQGIRPGQILRVYPLQMVFRDLQEPVAIGKRVIVNEGGSVVALPRDIISSKVQEIDLNSLKLPKKGLPLRTYSTGALSQEQLVTLSILLLIALLLYGAQLLLHKRQLASLQSQEAVVRGRYHLPPTSIQLRNILASLEKIEARQLRIREVVEYLLQAPLAPEERFHLVQIAKGVRVEIHLSSRKRAKAIERYLRRKLDVTRVQLQGDRLLVEGAL